MSFGNCVNGIFVEKKNENVGIKFKLWPWRNQIQRTIISMCMCVWTIMADNEWVTIKTHFHAEWTFQLVARSNGGCVAILPKVNAIILHLNGS